MFYFGIIISVIISCREETIWLVPYIAFMVLVTIIPKIAKKNINKKYIGLYFMPIFLVMLSINIVCTLNKNHYGVYTFNQYWGREYKEAYGALTRIKPIEEIQRVPVTKETMERLYKISSKFAELQDYFEGNEGKSWALVRRKNWRWRNKWRIFSLGIDGCSNK